MSTTEFVRIKPSRRIAARRRKFTIAAIKRNKDRKKETCRHIRKRRHDGHNGYWWMEHLDD